MLSVPPASIASSSSCSHACFALVIAPSTSAIRSSLTCFVRPSEQRRCTLFQSESRRLTTGAVVSAPRALERMLAIGVRAAALLVNTPSSTRSCAIVWSRVIWVSVPRFHT